MNAPRLQTRLFGASFLVACSLALAGCASTPDVQTDHDPSANFTSFHTYYWAKEPETANPLAKQRLIDGIDARMRAEGLSLAPEGSADLAIIANVATQQQQSLDTFYSGGGYYGWGWGGMGTATTTVRTYTVGTLVLDMFDAKTKKAVWRGVASGTVPDSKEKLATAVNAGLDKMFADFPPGSAGK
ncbi:hypothetical protein LYSHEL_22370 [Lysobacter helvus]|uniref:DUF4136 domain-containing protein n=2 Tax=Lysobacteraceae TaxID=32033 RepID=A0ABN6FU02_9GAMM|nr:MULTISPECIES: DUF4136 domain-containing protein [Lysobacter]BCT93214.1 hypothetical protein LYSCAS_22380 [Lysobacter caseinilyticus]BCT96366.1 hypothetical protein LYSHEL_22370 [Lysobacter helvus]